MKNYILASIFAIIGLSALGLVASAFGPMEESEARAIDKMGQVYGPPSGAFYFKLFPADTITNAEKDTLTLPNFQSNFQLQVAATRTSLSGTHNVKVYLDESNYLSGTDNWRVIDSTSTTTATLSHVRQSVTYSPRYRLRVSGTGTQSSRYIISVTGKRIYQ